MNNELEKVSDDYPDYGCPVCKCDKYKRNNWPKEYEKVIMALGGIKSWVFDPGGAEIILNCGKKIRLCAMCCNCDFLKLKLSLPIKYNSFLPKMRQWDQLAKNSQGYTRDDIVDKRVTELLAHSNKQLFELRAAKAQIRQLVAVNKELTEQAMAVNAGAKNGRI